MKNYYKVGGSFLEALEIFLTPTSITINIMIDEKGSHIQIFSGDLTYARPQKMPQTVAIE